MSSPHLPALARLADHLIAESGTEGGLNELIRTCRENGQAFETIAEKIRVETGDRVKVSGVTVMSWAARLGFDTSRTSRAAS